MALLSSERTDNRYEVRVAAPNGRDWLVFWVRDSTDPNLGEKLFDALRQLETSPVLVAPPTSR